MKALPFPPSVVLATGLALGVMGDVLLRAPGAPGLNLFVWIAAVAGVTILLHRRRGHGLSTEAVATVMVGVLFAAGLAWRDSPALKLIAVGGAAVCFALPVFRAGAAWIRNSGVAGYAAALAAAAGQAVFGAALVTLDVDWASPRREPQYQSKWRQAGAIARGAAIAVPLIIVFGGLFVSADAVFAGMVADVVRIDLDAVASP
jgi:hypothetical protein